MGLDNISKLTPVEALSVMAANNIAKNGTSQILTELQTTSMLIDLYNASEKDPEILSELLEEIVKSLKEIQTMENTVLNAASFIQEIDGRLNDGF